MSLQAGIDPDELDSGGIETKLEHVSTLRDRVRTLNAESPARRLETAAIVVAGGLAVIAMTVLVVRRIPQTTIESELTLSELGFSLADDSPILEPTPVQTAIVHDISSAIFPDGSMHPGSLMQLSTAKVPRSANAGQITLPGLRLPAHTQVSVRHQGPNRFEIGWTQAKATKPLGFVIEGPIEVSLVTDKGYFRLPLNRAEQTGIQVVPAGESLNIEFSLKSDATVELLPQLPIERLTFGDSDTESVLRGTSAILSGFFATRELGTDKVQLRRAERFRISGGSWSTRQGDWITGLLGRSTVASGMRVRRVSLSKQGLKTEIYGQAASVSYGPFGVERNGMPTELEWVAANQRIKLIWTAVVFAAGLVVGFARWFRRS